LFHHKKITFSQLHIVQSLSILANSNLSLTFLTDKAGFETFSTDVKDTQEHNIIFTRQYLSSPRK
jgi:hypothetical protein